MDVLGVDLGDDRERRAVEDGEAEEQGQARQRADAVDGRAHDDDEGQLQQDERQVPLGDAVDEVGHVEDRGRGGGTEQEAQGHPHEAHGQVALAGHHGGRSGLGHAGQRVGLVPASLIGGTRRRCRARGVGSIAIEHGVVTPSTVPSTVR